MQIKFYSSLIVKLIHPHSSQYFLVIFIVVNTVSSRNASSSKSPQQIDLKRKNLNFFSSDLNKEQQKETQIVKILLDTADMLAFQPNMGLCYMYQRLHFCILSTFSIKVSMCSRTMFTVSHCRICQKFHCVVLKTYL